MALSDPVNVRAGLARKQKVLARLAQQMAARGGRAHGPGAQFASAANLRVGGPRGVALPAGAAQMMRNLGLSMPAGFDPGASWNAPDVIPSGPPAGAGGGAPVATSTTTDATPLNSAGYPENTSYADLGITPDWTVQSDPPSNISSTPPGTISSGTAPNTFGNPAAPYYPDPYSVLADMQLRRLMAGTSTAYAV